MPLTVISGFFTGDNRARGNKCEMGFSGRKGRGEVSESTQNNVGAGLPAIAVGQSPNELTDTPPSRASPLPQGFCIYKVSVRRFTNAPGNRLDEVLRWL